MAQTRPIVGRLAPSPTGGLHLGHARSFLLAYWQARSQKGKLVLRIEDVDVSRSSLEHAEQAVRDLEWLGLDWEGPPVMQTEHVAATRLVADELLARGLAYPCTCTRRELREAASSPEGAPQLGVVELRYPGTCRGRFNSIQEAERTTGRAAGVRLITRDEPTEFVDGIYGAQSFNVQRDVGDFLILRRDKTPAYQLAVTVSDQLDEVSEVVRGADLLASTARQILIYRAQQKPPPRFFHLPLVVDEKGRRLAKRELDLSLRELREGGMDPRQVVHWVARSAGQRDVTDRGTFSAREFVDSFDIGLVGLEPVVVLARDSVSSILFRPGSA